MSANVEYYEEIDEENEDLAVEQLESDEYYEDDNLQQIPEVVEESPPVVAPKKVGTVVLKPGIITLPVQKKLVPLNDRQKVKDVLEKHKLKAGFPENNENVLQKTSVKERFEHRKRIMAQQAQKLNSAANESPLKKAKLSNSSVFDTYDITEGRKIYWNTEKDLKMPTPNMFDTELLYVVLENQKVMDMKLNLIHKHLTEAASSKTVDIFPALDHTTDTEKSPPKKTSEPKVITFSQIPIRNNDEFRSLEEELKEKPESTEKFEALLESLEAPENYSDFIKQVRTILFTTNFMESLGWSQVGLGGLQLKETMMKECIYRVFAKKYVGLQEESLNDKFSQHFRSFRLLRSKARKKQKVKKSDEA